ncbi:MAG: AMP-binding protein [Bryobacteraceae bacterium]
MPALGYALAVREILSNGFGGSPAPDAPAIVFRGREPLTYADLKRRVETIRAELLDAGIRPGGVVAVALPVGPDFISTFLAAASIGAFAPLDPAFTEAECRSHLGRLGAQALISEDGTPAANSAGALGIRLLVPRGPVGVSPLSRCHSKVPTGRSTDAALLLLTSATTGSPKLVPLTWENLRAMTLHDARALQLNAGDRFLSLAPLYHLHGLSAMLTQLLCGGTVLSTSGFDSAGFLDLLAEFRPTWFSSSPTLHRAVLALAREHPGAFRSSALRFIRSTGAGLEPKLIVELEEATGVPVLEGYGMTETGGIARSTLKARKPGSVGRSSGLEIAIVDPGGIPVSPGCEGEIVVRGPSVASGYIDDGSDSFRDGWFHTGDLGRLDEDGFLFLSGRIKEMINRGGKKVAPNEVESVLAAHPAVAEAAAFAVPHRTLGEDVAAAVVLNPGETLTEIELRRFAAMHLAAFKRPRRIAFVDRIPRSATGKPKRSLLAVRIPDHVVRAGFEEWDSVSRKIAAIWERLLDVPDLTPGDDFFLAGGDSLTCATMLAEVCRTFHVNPEYIPALEFFDDATIASLARMIAVAQTDTRSSGCIAFRTAGSRPPLFCIPGGNRTPYYFRHLAKTLGSDQPFYAVCPPVHGDSLCSIEDAARFVATAIRRVRHAGPYLVAGHCYGGVVAFETARQMILQGEPAVSLILFDTPTPGYPKLGRHWRRYLAEARRMASAVRQNSRPLSAAEAAAHIRTVGRIVGRRLTGLATRRISARYRSPSLARNLDPKVADGLAMRGYTPRALAAPIIQFLAAEHPASTAVLDDPRLGWGDFAPAGFEVCTVPGNHDSMFEPAHAQALAERLQQFLGFGR